MTIQDLLAIIPNQTFFLKIILILLLSLYGLFALIVAMQIKNLNNIVNQIKFSQTFILLSFLHSLGALALLIATVIFL